MPLKESATICKTILRNGYDAYIISAALQQELHEKFGINEIDIACEPNFETLGKFFSNLERCNDDAMFATLKQDDLSYNFYSTNTVSASHPDTDLIRITPRLFDLIKNIPDIQSVVLDNANCTDCDPNFDDFAHGSVRFLGLPSITLAKNYSLAIRALRYAANYDLPIEPATWIAIVQATNRIINYVPAREFLYEWQQVAAENMWRFIQMLSDSFILHGFLPEVAALKAVYQNKNKENNELISVFDHSILCMKYYPEEKMPLDWIGTVAMLLHDVGKLYTAESINDRWTFYQHHRVGAKVARKILHRLHFKDNQIDTICDLINNHMRFRSMLTDRGLRRFIQLPDNDRLIEMVRANIKADTGSYTNLNHNCKYIGRASTPEQMIEPLLNGNEIMEFTGLEPGPEVGVIRQALLAAQIENKVNDLNSAVAFVREYKKTLTSEK